MVMRKRDTSDQSDAMSKALNAIDMAIASRVPPNMLADVVCIFLPLQFLTNCANIAYMLLQAFGFSFFTTPRKEAV